MRQSPTDLVADDEPDAVVMDLSWPGPDGCALAWAVCRAACRRPLLVAVTGLPREEGRTRAAGFDPHLLEPADPIALGQAIRTHVDRRRSA